MQHTLAYTPVHTKQCTSAPQQACFPRCSACCHVSPLCSTPSLDQKQPSTLRPESLTHPQHMAGSAPKLIAAHEWWKPAASHVVKELFPAGLTGTGVERWLLAPSPSSPSEPNPAPQVALNGAVGNGHDHRSSQIVGKVPYRQRMGCPQQGHMAGWRSCSSRRLRGMEGMGRTQASLVWLK